jgi:polyhydroxyalkanoate synthase subunit PhaE
VDHDLWRQWQALAALWVPGRPDSQASSGRDGAFGFTPIMDVAERFTAAARSFLDGAANASAPAAGEAALAFSDYLREQFADFQLPGSSGFGAGHGAQSAFTGDSPALGATREHQQRWRRMTEASRRIADAQHRLQRLWSDALREAAAAFAARLVPPPQPTAVSAEALRKLYDTWIDCAEDAYARMAHSEPFCNALAEYVNASSQWRRELQASIEHWAKLLDLPTRSEINTLTQRLRSAEELLRAARKERKPRVKGSRVGPARLKVPSRRKARP